MTTRVVIRSQAASDPSAFGAPQPARTPLGRLEVGADFVLEAARQAPVCEARCSDSAGHWSNQHGQPHLARSDPKSDQQALSLFHRRSRRLKLNEAGMSFLEHVRDAMRRIDDGLQVLQQGAFVGPVRIAASNSICHALVLPALSALAQSHPGLTPSIVGIDEAQASAMLRKGSLDVAILERTEADDHLSVEQLGVTTYGVYCGRSHPLWEATACSVDDALEHGFVAPPATLDNWPLNTRRQVALFVNALDLALEVCHSGRLLAFLPDDMARSHQTDLRRLPLPLLV